MCALDRKCRRIPNECDNDLTCRYKYSLREYCCERNPPEHNICKSSCVGESCSKDTDCAPDEGCASDNKCESILTACSSNFECVNDTSIEKYCCKGKDPDVNV